MNEHANLTRPAHKITTLTCDFPTGLINAGEAAAKSGLSTKRLLELAADDYVPHWRIDGGEPLFKIGDLKRWCARNLVSESKGLDLPRRPVSIVIEPDPADATIVPGALREVENLRDISAAIRLATSGIYFLCYASQIVYIGQSVSAISRIQSHIDQKQFDQAFLLPWPRCDLDRLEGALIRHLRPPLNGNPGPTGGCCDTELKDLARQILDPSRATTC